MKRILNNLVPVLVIFVVNLILVRWLFLGGYTQQIGSIESVFIADAQFIFQHFPHLRWNPYWYAGFPFCLFYTPLLPFLMAAAHWLQPTIDIASWYRIWIGLFYALTPVSLYLLVGFLTGQKKLGFLAALIYSFLPSLAYVMPQVGSLAGIYGDAPWQLLTLILFGEGGHIVGLFFLPLALLFFIKTIRAGLKKDVFLAAILIGLLALANMIALIAFAVMAIIALGVELLEGEVLKKIGRFGPVLIFSFGLSAFWYNLSFIKASLSIGTGGVKGGLGEVYLPFLPIIFLLIPILWVFARLGRNKNYKLLLLAASWILIFFWAAYFWFNNQTMWLPQPNRYLPEMGMGVSLFLAWGLSLLLKNKSQLWYVPVCLLILYSPLKYIKQVWQLTVPHQNIQQTSEYRIASWLKDNTQGERVYASGSSAFWLNTFLISSRIPQMRGGNDGVANPWWLHGIYQINTADNAPVGQEGKLSINWLRIFNARYLVVNFPSSEEIYHDFRFPERFALVAGVEKLVDLNGDVIYKLPLNQPSLAQVVRKADFESLIEPKNAVDIEAINRYANYIDEVSAKEAKFDWTGIGRAVIKADLDEKEGLAVQVSYNPGWQASIANRKIKIKKDILGFMFLQLDKTGPVEINLIYARTGDVWLGYLITFLTIIGLLAYLYKNE